MLFFGGFNLSNLFLLCLRNRANAYMSLVIALVSFCQIFTQSISFSIFSMVCIFFKLSLTHWQLAFEVRMSNRYYMQFFLIVYVSG